VSRTIDSLPETLSARGAPIALLTRMNECVEGEVRSSRETSIALAAFETALAAALAISNRRVFFRSFRTIVTRHFVTCEIRSFQETHGALVAPMHTHATRFCHEFLILNCSRLTDWIIVKLWGVCMAQIKT